MFNISEYAATFSSLETDKRPCLHSPYPWPWNQPMDFGLDSGIHQWTLVFLHPPVFTSKTTKSACEVQMFPPPPAHDKACVVLFFYFTMYESNTYVYVTPGTLLPGSGIRGMFCPHKMLWPWTTQAGKPSQGEATLICDIQWAHTMLFYCVYWKYLSFIYFHSNLWWVYKGVNWLHAKAYRNRFFFFSRIFHTF